MSTATLVRRHLGAERRARDTYETDGEVETLYEGTLAGAIAAAQAIPANDRREMSIETDDAIYGPDDFDRLTPNALPLADLDMPHGSAIIRVEAAALDLLRGDQRMQPAMAIVSDHLDTIGAIVKHKQITDDVEDLGGKRLVRITAADIEAA